jgi:cytochrome c-type biogenesis protein CcmH/NrfG
MIIMRKDFQYADQCIEMANKYLKLDMGDLDMWQFLTDMYLEKQNYSKAQYCFEEMLMLQPNNFRVNLRFGEILYSVSGLDNLYHARKYFAHACILNDKYPRAFFGLL